MNPLKTGKQLLFEELLRKLARTRGVRPIIEARHEMRQRFPETPVIDEGHIRGK